MRVFGSPLVRVPRVARKGVTTMHACVWDGHLVYRAQDGAPPGLYLEDPVGVARTLMPDDSDHVHVMPLPAADSLLVHVVKSRSIPPVPSEVIQFREGDVVLRVPGNVAGVSADGAHAVVLDMKGRMLRAVDVRAARVRDVVPLQGGLEPMLAVPPCVSADGTRALIMDSTQEAGTGNLLEVDLGTGRITPLLKPQPPPSRVAATWMPDGSVLAVECSAHTGPRTRVVLLQDGRQHTVLEWLRLSPPVVPHVVDDHHVLLVLTAEGNLVDVHALDVRSGQVMVLTQNGRLTGRFTRLEDSVLMEGNAFVAEIPLAPRSRADVQ